MDARHLNLTLLFDMGKYQQAREFIDTTRKYFSKTRELVEFFKTRHTDFIKYYKLLLKYADKPDRVSAGIDCNKLREEIIIRIKSGC